MTSYDSTVWMWNADRGAYLNMFSGHGSGLTCGDFTTDGTNNSQCLFSM